MAPGQLPAHDAGPVIAVNKDAGETIGWPELAQAVARARRALPSKAHAVIFTANYGGLAVIALMLARVEWTAQQADGPPPEHTLIEYLQLLSTAAAVPRGLSGQCTLVERYPPGPSQTVSLRVEHATMTVQAGAGTARPDVRVSGLLPAWDEALMHGNTDDLLISGDVALFHVVLQALHDATS